MEDATEILRMEEPEVSEIAIKLYDFGKLQSVYNKLSGALSKEVNQQGKPIFEVHTWETLSPFYNIARMIDVMTLFHQDHAHSHCTGEHYERHDHGGL